MVRMLIVLAGVFGFLGVAYGAFGAHALREKLNLRDMAIYQTAVQYQFWHALAILAAAWVTSVSAGRLAPIAGISFAVGVVIFSGSLYALVLTQQRWLGAITPIGGVAFLVGWACLTIAGWSAFRS